MFNMPPTGLSSSLYQAQTGHIHVDHECQKDRVIFDSHSDSETLGFHD